MKRSIGRWQLLGFFVTAIGGTILHFLYEWLGGAVWVAPFSGVNESTWEHMKLLFWPMFIFAIVESFFFRDREDFWCVKLRGILLGLSLIPIIFYPRKRLAFALYGFFAKLFFFHKTSKSRPKRRRHTEKACCHRNYSHFLIS